MASAYVENDDRYRDQLVIDGDAENSELESLGLLTPGEVAGILHVDANTVARWSNSGKLSAVRTPGGHRRYYTREVLELARRGRSR
jgi:excisionase family DNA binding protein